MHLLETSQNRLDKNKLHPNKQIKLMQTFKQRFAIYSTKLCSGPFIIP